MKILDKLALNGRMILTLEGDVLGMNASKVIIDDKKYDYDIAYDMKNTIGVKVDCIIKDEIDFV